MIEIPNFKTLDITDIVCDYNGTIAKDGILLSEVKKLFQELAQHYKLHVITADTFGTVTKQLADDKATVKILTSKDHTKEKAEYINTLDAQKCIAIGNGNNDKDMLKTAAIGIAILGDEGCATQALFNADICCKNINDALKMLLHTKRLVATLRN